MMSDPVSEFALLISSHARQLLSEIKAYKMLATTYNRNAVIDRITCIKANSDKLHEAIQAQEMLVSTLKAQEDTL